MGLVNRARRNFAAAVRHDPAYVQDALALLRHESLDEIYRRHHRRWKLGKAGNGANFHAIKVEQGKGIGMIVVLALVPKADSDSRVLIVSVFRRRHKGGRQYTVTPGDISALEDEWEDTYDSLVASCQA